MAIASMSTITRLCAYCNGRIDCRTIDTIGDFIYWFCHERCRDAFVKDWQLMHPDEPPYQFAQH